MATHLQRRPRRTTKGIQAVHESEIAAGQARPRSRPSPGTRMQKVARLSHGSQRDAESENAAQFCLLLRVLCWRLFRSPLRQSATVTRRKVPRTMAKRTSKGRCTTISSEEASMVVLRQNRGLGAREESNYGVDFGLFYWPAGHWPTVTALLNRAV